MNFGLIFTQHSKAALDDAKAISIQAMYGIYFIAAFSMAQVMLLENYKEHFFLMSGLAKSQSAKGSGPWRICNTHCQQQ